MGAPSSCPGRVAIHRLHAREQLVPADGHNGVAAAVLVQHGVLVAGARVITSWETAGNENYYYFSLAPSQFSLVEVKE